MSCHQVRSEKEVYSVSTLLFIFFIVIYVFNDLIQQAPAQRNKNSEFRNHDHVREFISRNLLTAVKAI